MINKIKHNSVGYVFHIYQHKECYFVEVTRVVRRAIKRFMNYDNMVFIREYRGVFIMATLGNIQTELDVLSFTKDLMDEYFAIGEFSIYRLAISDDKSWTSWNTPKHRAIITVSQW